MTWEVSFIAEMTKGLKNHHQHLIKDNAWYACRKCEFKLPHYKGTGKIRYCPNCGEDMSQQEGFPRSPSPDYKAKDKEQTVVDSIDSLCRKVETLLNLPERHVRLEAVDGQKCLFSVMNPKSPGRFLGTFALPMAEVSETSIHAKAKGIVETGDSLPATGPNMAQPKIASGLGTLEKEEPVLEGYKMQMKVGDWGTDRQLIVILPDGTQIEAGDPFWPGGVPVVPGNPAATKKAQIRAMTQRADQAIKDHKAGLIKKESVSVCESRYSEVLTFGEAKEPEGKEPEKKFYKLFVYGQLADPKVRREVFGREPEFELAELKGFVLANEMDEQGNAFVTLRTSKKSDKVRGVLLTLGEEDLNRVDHFEDERYSRIVMPINGEQAYVYIIKNAALEGCLVRGQVVLEKLEPLPIDECDPFELKIGIRVEKEHTDDEKQASEIARQHLQEEPHYYEKLFKAKILSKEELGDELWDEASDQWPKSVDENDPRLSGRVTFGNIRVMPGGNIYRYHSRGSWGDITYSMDGKKTWHRGSPHGLQTAYDQAKKDGKLEPGSSFGADNLPPLQEGGLAGGLHHKLAKDIKHGDLILHNYRQIQVHHVRRAPDGKVEIVAWDGKLYTFDPDFEFESVLAGEPVKETLGGDQEGPADATAEPAPGGQTGIGGATWNIPMKGDDCRESFGYVDTHAVGPRGDPNQTAGAQLVGSPKESEEVGKRVCSWCNKELGPAPGLKAGEVTHGMCQDCYDRVKKEILAKKAMSEKLANTSALAKDNEIGEPDKNLQDPKYLAQADEEDVVHVDNPTYQGEPVQAKDKDDGKDQLGEGVYDPHILKAVFLAGGGGSGKSAVASQMFGVGKSIYGHFPLMAAGGMKSYNTDDVFELLSYSPDTRKKLSSEELKSLGDKIFNLKPSKLGGDMESYEVQHVIRPLAKRLASDRASHWMDGRLGMFIDGTGADFGKIAGLKGKLDALGYDTYMVFVKVDIETAVKRNKGRDREVPEGVLRQAHEEANENLESYKSLFGSRFYTVVNNELDKASWEKAGHDRWKQAQSLINEPIRNPTGKEWIENELLKKKLAGQLDKLGIKEAVEDTVPGTMGSREYKAAVAVIINSAEEVLLGRAKTDDDRNGKWCFPGGGIDPEDGADPLMAAAREAYEETSLEVRPKHIIDHPGKPGVAFVECAYVSGTPTPNAEFLEFQWVPLDAVEDYPDIYSFNKQVLQRVTRDVLEAWRNDLKAWDALSDEALKGYEDLLQ